MGDFVLWALFALVLGVMIWSFWPRISNALRITANEGDELMADVKKIKKTIKTKLK